MPKRKDLAGDLDRLVVATVMFATQELERATLGDDQDFDDAENEAREVIGNVLKVIEKSLDEDLLEDLDRGDYSRIVPSYSRWPLRRFWPYFGMRLRRRTEPRSHKIFRRNAMLGEILEDFKVDFESRLKRARREGRSLSDDELEDALKELREDLKLVVRRSHRRENRREDRDEAQEND